MSNTTYNLTHYNGNPWLTIPTGALDQTTTLNLVGYAYQSTTSSWGSITDENFLYQLENFASPSPPINLTPGQLFYQTQTSNNGLLNYCISNPTNKAPTVVQLANVYVQNNQPANTANISDFWLNNSNYTLSVYNGNTWSEVSTNIDISAISVSVVTSTYSTPFNATNNLQTLFNALMIGTAPNQLLATNSQKQLQLCNVVGDLQISAASNTAAFTLNMSIANLNNGGATATPVAIDGSKQWIANITATTAVTNYFIVSSAVAFSHPLYIINQSANPLIITFVGSANTITIAVGGSAEIIQLSFTSAAIQTYAVLSNYTGA